MKLIQLTQKITLIFVRIPAAHQSVFSRVIHPNNLLLANVVSRCHKIGTQLQRLIQKHIKFNLAITQNIGIGRSSATILRKHIVYNTFLVQGTQIQYLKGNSQMLSHQHCISAIVDPWTFIFQGNAGVIPIAHEKSDDLMTLLLQQQSHHRAINSATHTNDNSRHGTKFGIVID